MQWRWSSGDGGQPVGSRSCRVPGSFAGEISQLSGTRSLVGAVAVGDVEALLINSEQQHASPSPAPVPRDCPRQYMRRPRDCR